MIVLPQNMANKFVDRERWDARSRAFLASEKELKFLASTIKDDAHYQALLTDVPNEGIRKRLDAALRPLISFIPSTPLLGSIVLETVEAPAPPEQPKVDVVLPATPTKKKTTKPKEKKKMAVPKHGAPQDKTKSPTSGPKTEMGKISKLAGGSNYGKGSSPSQKKGK